MSRVDLRRCSGLHCFPRVSGDEPVGSELWASRDAFSPRERG